MAWEWRENNREKVLEAVNLIQVERERDGVPD